PVTSVWLSSSWCTCTSPNSSLFMMLPVPLTSTEPSARSFHFASPPLAPRHLERSFPSNKTTASAGGGPGSMIGGSFSSLFSAVKPSQATNKQRVPQKPMHRGHDCILENSCIIRLGELLSWNRSHRAPLSAPPAPVAGSGFVA